jgi:hypothetical protein
LKKVKKNICKAKKHKSLRSICLGGFRAEKGDEKSNAAVCATPYTPVRKLFTVIPADEERKKRAGRNFQQ